MIKLPHGWFIGADQYQYKVGNTTSKRKNKDTGVEETTYVYDKYTTTLAEAFRVILAAESRKAIAAQDMNISEALNKIEKIEKEWEGVLKKAFKIEREDYFSELEEKECE